MIISLNDRIVKTFTLIRALDYTYYMKKKVYFILPEEQNHKMLLPLHAEPGMVQAFEEVLVEGLPVVRNSF